MREKKALERRKIIEQITPYPDIYEMFEGMGFSDFVLLGIVEEVGASMKALEKDHASFLEGEIEEDEIPF